MEAVVDHRRPAGLVLQPAPLARRGPRPEPLAQVVVARPRSDLAEEVVAEPVGLDDAGVEWVGEVVLGGDHPQVRIRALEPFGQAAELRVGASGADTLRQRQPGLGAAQAEPIGREREPGEQQRTGQPRSDGPGTPPGHRGAGVSGCPGHLVGRGDGWGLEDHGLPRRLERFGQATATDRRHDEHPDPERQEREAGLGRRRREGPRAQAPSGRR